MPVKATSSTTATPAPMIMPHMRCRPCRPRHAMAMTSALSPDSKMLIQMILPTASQNAGRCISAWNCVKNAPILAGSNTCKNEFTAYPSIRHRPAAKHEAPSADDFVARKELRDLDRGRLGCVRPVHRIFADRFGMQLADRAVRSLGGIGRTHHV